MQELMSCTTPACAYLHYWHCDSRHLSMPCMRDWAMQRGEEWRRLINVDLMMSM